jgi:hypothetical protein
MKIPEIRDRLNELSAMHSIPELAHLADELTRRKAKKKAPVTSAPMTPELAAAIRAFAAAHTSLSQTRIAEIFKVNPGRVGEDLNGKRR